MQKKVLIIDDEEEVVSLLTIRLKDAGFKTVSALDGKKGLELAEKEQPDIIILDIMMPLLDGYQFCLLLHADVRLKHIPVIMLTCLDNQVDKVAGKAFGVADYFTKPFDSAHLIERIKTIVFER